MEPQFVDRILNCSDCHSEFVFTAGEQLFFHDKQFKNDPKRCKPCKCRRSGLSAVASGAPGPAAAGLSRTETRTECSECGIETTVPFKPTQGRPVLCRQCFQVKTKAAATPATVSASLETTLDGTASALANAFVKSDGSSLSQDAAIHAAASMASASPFSSVASAADLASISPASTQKTPAEVPVSLVVASAAAKALEA